MSSPYDDLPDAVVVLDGDGMVLDANRAVQELTGHGPAALAGAPVGATLRFRRLGGLPVDGDGAPGADELHHRRMLGDTADGTAVTVDVTARARAGGGVVVVLRPVDIENGAIEIVSTVSHELRSPLTSVKGYTALLLNRWDRLDDDQKKMMLEQVHLDADRVTRMVTELLDISRLETGRLQLRRQLLDLPDLARSVVATVGRAYPELECEVTFPEQFPKVMADPDKITQVLTNLVENAAKYGSPTGMRVAGELLKDGLGRGGAAPTEAVRVAVHDRGEGIPPEDLPRVFTKFFRRELGRPTGTGLGLWISRGLVEVHGGELTAVSAPGQGSSFAFTLPLLSGDELGG
ncbi:ATP-binding protein [soil metagenome]